MGEGFSAAPHDSIITETNPHAHRVTIEFMKVQSESSYP